MSVGHKKATIMITIKNNIKKNAGRIMAIAAAFTLASCSLDVEPETSMTDAAYWKSEGDLRGACNRLYQQMGGSLGGFSHDYRSDELRGTSANGISDGSRTVPNSSGDWTDPYWRIFISNNIIEKSKNANVTDEVRNLYIAEAKFFRAFHYFALLQKYGGVPVLEKAIDATDDPAIYSPRSEREEVLNLIYSDLDFAAQWLPAIDKVKEWGLVSRSAALAMIVRVGLYEGTYAKYHALAGEDYKAHLDRAIKAAESMKTDDKHSLYPDFQKLFLFDGEGRQNKENVFVKVYGPNGAGTTVHGNSRQLENTVSLTRNMVDMFLYADGLPGSKSKYYIAKETSYNDVFKNRDPRLTMTCYQAGEEAYKGALTPFGYRYGYNIKKGFDLTEWSSNSKETIDKMVIRYAEVLISYAEALYERNGSISNAVLDETVNKIRERAGFNVKLTNEFVAANGLDMLEEIRRERTVEFIDENMRYDDIIRWKIAEKVLPNYLLGARLGKAEVSGGVVEQLGDRITLNGGYYNGEKICDQDSIYILELKGDRRFDPAKDYLYPVPLQEISRSNLAVKQNPKW